MSGIALDDVIASDPTWQKALGIVNSRINADSQVWSLVKSSWYGDAEMANFVRAVSFTHLEPRCLLVAAGMDDPRDFNPDMETLKQAISFLGFRYSAVVLAANLSCLLVLKTNPESYWKALFKDMIKSIEIGYHMGAKCRELALEGGALMGFARHIGRLVLLAEDYGKYKEWQAQKDEPNSKQLQLELFGCQEYQTAALVIQKLGFGSEAALGTALAVGKLATEASAYTREILSWRAAIYWIEALSEGRNYPPETKINRFFSELAPAGEGSDNLNLNALLNEVAPINANGSSWRWHLPKGVEEY